MLKAFIAAAAVAAVAIGLILPVPHKDDRGPALKNSQFATFDLGAR